jgi:hypothetical protein
VRRFVRAFLPVTPALLTPLVWLWLNHHASTAQDYALADNLTAMYFVLTAIAAIVARAWMGPGPRSER